VLGTASARAELQKLSHNLIGALGWPSLPPFKIFYFPISKHSLLFENILRIPGLRSFTGRTEISHCWGLLGLLARFNLAVLFAEHFRTLY
jgi:hypothetical protein